MPDLAALKAGGVLKQRQPNLFSIRLRIPLGDIKTDVLKRVSEIAEEYGQGIVHLTMRQGIEIPHVRLEDIERVEAALAAIGLKLGACGPRVRVVTACNGSALCLHGLADTKALAAALDEKFYGRSGIPHKFKMGVTGCPNSCAKPQENDVGFIAVVEPVLDESGGSDCISCGLCADVCPSGAITMVDDKPVIDLSRCYGDGKCVNVCPTAALRAQREGWDVYVGGKWGKAPQIGALFERFASNDAALELVERLLDAYCRLAKKGERLGDLVNRIGIEKLRKETAVERT